MLADVLVEVVCHYGNAASFRVIFINMNALVNRMLLVWALSSDVDVWAIMFTVAIDFLFVFSFTFFVSGPLYIHGELSSAPKAFLHWMLGKEDNREKYMSVTHREHCVCERAKWVYFTVLHSTGEIIMPWWQLFFYYILYSTATRSALSGFEEAANGFPLINGHDLLVTAVSLGSCDVVDFLVFTYIVRRKFPDFTPWRLLNVTVKKYNTLLALSVMSVVISVQCVLIIDCRFDFTTGGFAEFVGYFKR